jgi:hypothetical protein
MKLLYAFGSSMRFGKFNRRQPDLAIIQELYKMDKDAFLVDRTKTMFWPFSPKLLEPEYTIPDLTVPAVTYEEAGIRRANELLDLNRPIYALWSGGIDSTFMLACFLLTGRSLDQITVAMNEESVKEYPLFYKKYVRPLFPRLESVEEVTLQAGHGNANGILLTGELNDNLFGNPMMNIFFRKFGPEVLSKPYSLSQMSSMLSVYGISDLSRQCILEVIETTFTNSPRPIDTVGDWAWWYGWNFKWQEVALKMPARFKQTTQVEAFFSSADYQRWSVNHEFDYTGLENVKRIPKQTILRLTNDQDYYRYKTKFTSTTPYYALPASAGIREDGYRISFEEFNPMDYYDPDNSIAKWLNNH